MWRIFLALVSHRAVLYVVALIGINVSLTPPGSENRALPVIQPIAVLQNHFATRIAAVPEMRQLEEWRHRSVIETIESHRNPFLWICRMWMGVTGWSVLSTVFLLSNLFLFFFLFQMFSIFNLLVTTDISRTAAYWIVFWPTSYELSLGSPVSFSCLLLATVLRSAVDQKWWLAGVSSALLLVSESWFLGMLPLLAALFWWHQRHSSKQVLLTQAATFSIPVALALVVYGTQHWQAIGHLSDQSAGTMLHWVLSGHIGRAVQAGNVGQVLSLLFFLTGAGASLFGHGDWYQRVSPMWLLGSVVLFTPVDGLASQLLLASLCLEGVASLSSPAVNGGLQMAMFLLGVWEAYNVFR